MERDTHIDSELQKVETTLRNCALRGLSGDDAFVDELDDILDSLILLKQPYRPSMSFHPSSIGGCKRMAYYTRSGMEPKANLAADPLMRSRMDASSYLHSWVQNVFNRLPGKKLIIKHEERIPETSPAREIYGISGKCDTVISLPQGETSTPIIIIDYKFISQGSFATTNSPKERDVKQLMCYLNGFSVPIGILWYFDKGTQLRKPFVVRYNENIWQNVLKFIEEIDGYVSKKEEPDRQVDFFVCKNICKYTHICKPPMRSRFRNA